MEHLLEVKYTITIVTNKGSETLECETLQELIDVHNDRCSDDFVLLHESDNPALEE